MLEHEILKNINLFIVLRNENNQIVYCNNPLAEILSNQNNNITDLYYDNKYYKSSVKKINLNDKLLTLEIYEDITEYKKELTTYSTYIQNLKKDKLTSLYNRHGIEDIFKWLKDKNITYSIILCDIDFFKKINDTYGHNIGDEALKYVSRILSHNAKKTAYVGRYGGEEFLMILPFCNKDIAYIIADNIKNTLNNTCFNFMNKDTMEIIQNHITMTFGISDYNLNKTIEDVINEADIALYKGKNNGRNTICIYEK